MTVYIVTYDVSETATPCRQYLEAFATMTEAQAYVDRDATANDFECYEIIIKTFS